NRLAVDEDIGGVEIADTRVERQDGPAFDQNLPAASRARSRTNAASLLRVGGRCSQQSCAARHQHVEKISALHARASIIRGMRRRDFLSTVATAGAAAAASSFTSFAQTAPTATPIKRKGRLKQSLFRTVFGQNTPGLTTFDDQCREAARLGAYG